MAVTINEEIYKYVAGNTDMQSAFNSISYLINDNKATEPYATIFLIDDPLNIVFNCVGEQGQSRFQCDTFARRSIDGINKRNIFQRVMRELMPSTLNGIYIWRVEVLNIADRGDVVNGLFQMQFEAIIHWEIT